jgi:hypothetical protein
VPLRVSGVRSWRGHLAALGIVVLLVLIGLLGSQQATEEVQTEQPEASATVGELVPGATVAQSFTAEYGGLAEVAVKVGTYKREHRGTLAFRLDGPGLTDAVTRTVDAGELEDNAYQAFEFPPIEDSAGRSYTFTLESPEAEPGEAVTVWGAKKDVYPDGQATLTGLYRGERVADLTFRLTYEPPLLDRADLFLERLAAGKPSLWGDRRLYVILGGAYLALFYALFVTAVGRDGPEEID